MELSKKDKTGLMLIILSLAGLLSFLVVIGIAHGDCYQPAADYTMCGGCENLTEDGGGSYTCWGDFNPSYQCENGYDIIGSCGGGAATDQAWATIAANSGSNVIPSGILIDWYKPDELKGNYNSTSYYVINDDSGTIAPYNVSIPLSCWQKDPDKLIFNISTLWYNPSPLHGSDHYCLNTSDQWQLIGFTDYRYYFITGSAIWWNSTLPPPCEPSFACTKFSVCDNFHKDCLIAVDSACGLIANASVLASFGKNCTINAQSESVEFLEFDLRYSSNVLLFIGLIMIWLILLGMAFAFSNYILYAAAFMASVFVGVIAAQISWIISIGIIMIMVVIGINYLSKFEN